MDAKTTNFKSAQMKNSITFLAVIFLILIHDSVLADLQVGFYNSSCPKAEAIVRNIVEKQFRSDRHIPAALLRMHFHDCFVKGCDASILIDDPPGERKSEKNAGANSSVRKYELIDLIKETLEAECPSTVSCADIITLATRDAVALAGGPKYIVPTGRRDGLVSDMRDVKLPGPSVSVSSMESLFANKGLTRRDMVALLGAHTVGLTHCSFFQHRLSSFRSGGRDPNMDPKLDAELVRICGSETNPIPNDPPVALDARTAFRIDNEFYKQILGKRGILEIDQNLFLDEITSGVVSEFARNGDRFQQSFEEAMIKMGEVDVLTGKDGEIRKRCGSFNQPAGG